MRRAAWTLGSLALAIACARRAAIPPPRAAPAAPPAAHTGVVLLPEYGQRVVAVEPDGSSDVLLSGGVRANVLDDEVRVARQSFVADVAAAWRTRAGWVFIARDGATARSDTFLGRLTRMRDLDAVIRHFESGVDNQSPHGIVLAVDRHGVAWSTDGASDWAPVPLPLPGHAIDVTAAPPGQGVVLLEGGYLVHTVDAGRSWARVRGVRATSLQAWGDMLLTSGGRLDAASHSLVPGEVERRDDAILHERVLLTTSGGAYLWAADPRYVDAVAWLPLADGNLVGEDGALVFYDGATGRVIARREVPPRAHPGAPGLTALPDGSLLVRRGSAEGERVLRFASDGTSLPSEGVVEPPAVLPPERPPPPDGVTLPPGAEAWAFAGERGMAWRVDPLTFHRTVDRGQTWTPWRLPIDGVAEGWRFAIDGPNPGRCSRWRCVIGRVVVWAWGSDDGPPSLFARRELAPEPRALPPWPDLDALRAPRCAAGASVRALPPYGTAPATARRLVAPGPGGEVELRWWRDAHDQAHGSIRWRGIDATGPWITAPVAWDDFAREMIRTAGSAPPAFTPIELARDRAVVGLAPPFSGHLLVSTRAPRRARTVESPNAHLVELADGPRVLDLASDRAATLLPFERPVGAEDRNVPPALWFSREEFRRSVEGELERRHPRRGDAPAFDTHAVARTWMALSFVARRGRTAGVLTVTDEARREAVLHLLDDGGEPTAVALPERATPRVCASDARPDDLTLVHRVSVGPSWGLTGERGSLSYMLELGADGLCLRRVEGSDGRIGVTLDARPDGALTGWITTGGRQRELRCVL